MSAWINGFWSDDNSYYYCGRPYFEACYPDLPGSAWTVPSQFDADTILLTITWYLAYGQSDYTEDMCAITIQAKKLMKQILENQAQLWVEVKELPLPPYLQWLREKE